MARGVQVDPFEVDPFEEDQHVTAGVAFAGLVQDLAGGDVKGGEQVGGTVAAVVVSHRASPAGFHGQRRLGWSMAWRWVFYRS